MSFKEEGTQPKVIRTMIAMFRANCMEVPRKIILTYGEFEAFKRSLGDVALYGRPEGDEHSIMFCGVLIARQPCTCGAL